MELKSTQSFRAQTQYTVLIAHMILNVCKHHYLTPVLGKAPFAERQKHSTELVIYCLYNWYVKRKLVMSLFIIMVILYHNYYLTRNMTVQNHSFLRK